MARVAGELAIAVQRDDRVQVRVQDQLVRRRRARLPIDDLTEREREVLALLTQGYTNRQIGEELSISIRTAESHRANLSEKLGLHSRVELVRYAREHGLIE